jgi:peptide/nickel transport system substrate-binding protein
MNKDSLNDFGNKEWHIPFMKRAGNLIQSFTMTEKIIFYVFSAVFVVSGITLLYKVNKNFLVEVPDYGGTLVEGVVGYPRFINPVLASSDSDKDLTSLVYSGLLKSNPDGGVDLDLAEKYNISDDGLTYTFTLKNNLSFHDGYKVTADDVVYTIEKIQDGVLKSPRSGSWEGVKVQKIDDLTVVFTLPNQYSPFIQNLTIGILPKHIWKNISAEEFPFSQFNVKPVGTGPYKIDSQNFSNNGLPNEYKLKSFSKYSLGRPFISNIVIKSYQTEKDLADAYKSGDVESMHSISPKTLTDLEIKKEDIKLSPLPRIFGVFFNQNVAQVLVNKEVRLALDAATDKKEIINNILNGYGKIINSPVPGIESDYEDATSTEARIFKAKSILEKAGWKINEDGIYQKKDKKGTSILSFSITTGDASELKETAMLLQRQWQKIGARVEVKIYEIGDLNQDIIRTRKYDSILFGEIIGKDLDLYPFWHSSQRNSPGLNIAMYANVKTDKALEAFRKTDDESNKTELLKDFDAEIQNDKPAIFTYSPYFIYVIPEKVKGVKIGSLTYSGERFSDVHKWYIETNNIWEIFKNN